MTCHRFTVHDVAASTQQLPPVTDDDLHKAWSKLGTVEAASPLACKDAQGEEVRAFNTFTKPNLLAAAVYKAFYDHHPLKLDPNSIWITIAQGFGRYVNANSEQLRDKFVDFQGKKTLTVERPEFVRGRPDNQWPNVFDEFSSRIKSFIGQETGDLIECCFSNTSPTDKIASHIVLMDAMQSYFKYDMRCGCGIPWIELTGTLDDWRLIRSKAQQLGAFALPGDEDILSNWMQELLPVLDKFVDAAAGKPDVTFFGSVCNLTGSSGMLGDPVTGWVQVFFPYLAGENRHNMYGIRQWREAYSLEVAAELEEIGWRQRPPGLPEPSIGTKLNEFPSGLSCAPFNWHDVSSRQTFKMAFYGGLVALHQDKEGALGVQTGWAVIEPPAASA